MKNITIEHHHLANRARLGAGHWSRRDPLSILSDPWSWTLDLDDDSLMITSSSMASILFVFPLYLRFKANKLSISFISTALLPELCHIYTSALLIDGFMTIEHLISPFLLISTKDSLTSGQKQVVFLDTSFSASTEVSFSFRFLF